MKNAEYDALYEACLHLDDGPDYRISSYALNLINTALDFQSNVTTVNDAMAYYRENIRYNSHRGLQGVVNQFPNTKRGNQKLASYIWSNNMWTRAEFLRMLLNEFELRGIRGQKSLERWLQNADFKRDIKGQFKSRHHSMGIKIFHWLCLRCGIDTVAPDVWILKFVSNTIGRKALPEESVQALVSIAKAQRRKAYRLDAAIWNAQRRRQNA